EGEFPANDRRPPTTAARARLCVLPRLRRDLQPRRPRQSPAHEGAADQGAPGQLAPLQEAAAARSPGGRLRKALPRRSLPVGRLEPRRLRLLRARALRLSAVRAQPAAQLVCGLQSRARRRPLGAEARRPRLLQRARPRRAVRRPRPLHPRAAQRHGGADLLACRMGRELLRRPPSSAGVGRVLGPNALRGAFAMDRPTLFPLVERLRALEKLPAFAAALPARARVSEPALPLLLAGLHEELERPLLVLLPEDADA